MKRFQADANIGLRILVGGNDIAAAPTEAGRQKIKQIVHDTHQLARQVFEGKVTLIFDDAVVEEMVFVLDKQYKLSRGQLSERILSLIEAENVEASPAIRETLKIFPNVTHDVVDIKLSVLSKENNIPILTWDKGFKHLGCEYCAPSDIILDD